ncbi:cuticle protein 63-like [Melitaea cinxia]|uniref:cuticle protein 63-like n=1 Tax=Melitaea cinxia TaxID=113334 RepID=UPI001E274064|nr:cuticle protein 63-like [Melitaea cinxia]
MNTYVTFVCLLAVAASAHGYGLGGWGGYGAGYDVSKIISAPILAPAVSTANVYKAAPIPIIKSVAVAPIITAPVIKTVPVASYNLGYSGLGGYGLGLGGYGLGKSLSYGLDYGYGKY